MISKESAFNSVKYLHNKYRYILAQLNSFKKFGPIGLKLKECRK